MTPGLLETSHLWSKKNTKKRTPAGQLDLTCLLLGFLGIRSDWRDFFRWPFLLCGQLWGVFFFFLGGGRMGNPKNQNRRVGPRIYSFLGIK